MASMLQGLQDTGKAFDGGFHVQLPCIITTHSLQFIAGKGAENFDVSALHRFNVTEYADHETLEQEMRVQVIMSHADLPSGLVGRSGRVAEVDGGRVRVIFDLQPGDRDGNARSSVWMPLIAVRRCPVHFPLGGRFSDNLGAMRRLEGRLEDGDVSWVTISYSRTLSLAETSSECLWVWVFILLYSTRAEHDHIRTRSTCWYVLLHVRMCMCPGCVQGARPRTLCS